MIILCDSGDRYLSKCYNDAWMKDLGFLGPEQRLGTVREVLDFKGGGVEFAAPEETLAHVAKRMSDLGISQMPVKRSGAGHLMIVHELDLLQGLVNGHCTPSDTVDAAAKPLEGQVALDDPLTRVQERVRPAQRRDGGEGRRRRRGHQQDRRRRVPRRAPVGPRRAGAAGKADLEPRCGTAARTPPACR